MKGIATFALAVFCLLGAVSTAQAAPPANDNFANAAVVGPALPVAAPGTNVEATVEPGEPSVYGNPPISSVWYRWTAPAAGQTVLDLCNDNWSGPSGSFRAAEVYTGATLGTLVSVAEGGGSDCLIRFNAALGQEYKFQVDYRAITGTFTFRLRQRVAPVNDNFAGSIALGPNLPVNQLASNVDSGHEAGEPPALGGPTNSRSVWFSWTAPANGPVRLDVCDFDATSGSSNLKLLVYTGATLGTLVPVIPTDSNCEKDFAASSGTTYRIAFSGDIRGEGAFTLRIRNAPPPSNDDFANATTVGPNLPVSVTGNNEFAGVEAGEPPHTGVGFPAARSVWFKWTAGANARVAINTCNREFGARIGVYTGASVNALTDVAEKPGFAPHCRVLLDAVAGTTYWLATGGGAQDGVYGEFVLQMRAEKKPTNDNFAKALKLTLKSDGKVSGTTVDATEEVGEPSHDPGSYSGGGGSVWYRWTATSAQPMILSACSKSQDLWIAAYTGSALEDLKQVASSGSGCGSGTKGGRLALAPVKGKTYRIAVAAKERDFPASFTLSSRGPYVAPKTYNLKKQLQSCKKIGKKSKRKRCQKNAREKNAVLNCQKKLDAAQQAECVKAARKRF
jgi:hypothetical protein